MTGARLPCEHPLEHGHRARVLDEIEFSQAGEGSGRVHDRIVRIDGPEMVIDGHLARHPIEVWSTI